MNGMERSHVIVFLLPFILWCSSSSSVLMAESGEVSALISFKKYSIEKDPKGAIGNWMSSSSNPCSWAGVICSEGRVQELSLGRMGLVGRPRLDDLMALPELHRIDLHGNFFYGNLSYAIGSSSLPCSLVSVDLSGNNFSDSIPGEFLASCSSLVSLNLSRNALPHFGYPFAPSLQVLDLSENKISDKGLLNYTLTSCHGLDFLNLSTNKLAGELPRGVSSPSCSNLTFLDLSSNLISGEIPIEFLHTVLPSLRLLDVSNNNLSGDFSALDFQGCSGLVMLNLSSNGLSGDGFPSSIANCKDLQLIDLSNNHLAGVLPTFWGGFSSLKQLSLANNRFSGGIPYELSSTCGTLTELDLSRNQFSGSLPASFSSCFLLRSLNLGNNQLSGDFITNVVSWMISLRKLYIPFNNITGTVPLRSLMNCSFLEAIDLSSNQFTGDIPISSGFCSSITNLRSLLLPDNFLSGTVPQELGSCSLLETLDLSFNYLSGSIPIEIGLLPKIVNLIMWANNLSGNIPDTICSNSASLETLILSYNKISGSIPPSFTKCVNLVWVSLTANHIVGEIPTGIGDLQSLAILQLASNSLSGMIPTQLGSCRNLIWLDLYSNDLSGPIPPSLASQSGLIVPGIVSGKQFAFLRNEAGNMCPGSGVLFEFEGIRPARLANFPLVNACPSTRIYTGTTVYSYTSNGSMIYLDLSYNSFSGTIPGNFGSMNYLQVLNLGHNKFTGMIPTSFSGLKMAMALDLSNNYLTGRIPGALGRLSFLTDFDVSNNNLDGMIPSSGQLTTFPSSRYENNSGLCGLPLPPCSTLVRSHAMDSVSHGRGWFYGGSILLGVALSVLIILSLVGVLYKLKKHQKVEEMKSASFIERVPNSGTTSWKISSALEPLSINVATFEKPLRKLTFAHLLEATNGFSAESLIGSGGFGDVYKAQLKDGSVVAIKKLIHVTGQGDREFTAEMETIGKIKHRNLAPLLGYCKIGDERLLVYEYMKFGSLDMVLHDKSKGGTKLDWAARKRIAIGSARGLAFLHHSCIPHIIHRDMKSSNVLLDENLEARVSDFGMARLMNALDTHLSVSTLAGTPGYVPPEYYQSFRCTTKGDVYSYGVVILELLSGKKPIDPLEFGDNNLVGWVKQLVKENRNSEVFDPVLIHRDPEESELYQYLRIACQCLDDRPLRRPTMIQVMAMFKELQTDSDSDFLEEFSMEQSTIHESRERSVDGSAN